jgi:hypothetical protein
MLCTVPLSIIRRSSLYTQQWYMSYRLADSLRAGSGWNGSSILILLASCQQTYMTYSYTGIPLLYTVKNSWWWTEKLSETCRVSFQEYNYEISASSWFHCKKFNTMYSHMNVKLNSTFFLGCCRAARVRSWSFYVLSCGQCVKLFLSSYLHLRIAEMHNPYGAERRIRCFSGWRVAFRKDTTYCRPGLPLLYRLVGAYPWTFYFGECKSLMWKMT